MTTHLYHLLIETYPISLTRRNTGRKRCNDRLRFRCLTPNDQKAYYKHLLMLNYPYPSGVSPDYGCAFMPKSGFPDESHTKQQTTNINTK
ncbi:hypothetical protein Htur_3344 [Haloterrigena turkmenica DSM 5511]|uniref:Uncharacterized protein n=1 Tax=Haloterrigena turkmenica (strain ATCC 51198 / DSM 5511 / JCM 9101 / NCIMB 13204 / VKM B-1734 / 4k) TaxID=543526 RepID=D2RPQ6_HALTV|nr:hypothetical protein Htur_3344 [Haloterrigena turkmenica DSM 5511]